MSQAWQALQISLLCTKPALILHGLKLAIFLNTDSAENPDGDPSLDEGEQRSLAPRGEGGINLKCHAPRSAGVVG